MKSIIKFFITSFISILIVACDKMPRIEEGDTFNLSAEARTFTIHTNAPIGILFIFDYTYDDNGIPSMVRPSSASSDKCCESDWYKVTKHDDQRSLTFDIKENNNGHERRFSVDFNCGRFGCFATVIQAAK